MFKQLRVLFVGLFAFFLLTSTSHAVRWSNQFVEFELPANWKCALEGAEWVCQNEDKTKMRDAIIILAAKIRGKQDSLEEYLKYLEKPKYYESISGKPVKSTPKWAKVDKFNEHPWVDSMHLESEIPGFYTRYLATVKNDIGVLVTYSVNQQKYQSYRGQFESMVKTLKVFRKPGQALNANPKDGNLFANAKIPEGLVSAFSDPFGIGKQEVKEEKQEEEDGDKGKLLLAILGVLILYIIIRRRRNS